MPLAWREFTLITNPESKHKNHKCGLELARPLQQLKQRKSSRNYFLVITIERLIKLKINSNT